MDERTVISKLNPLEPVPTHLQVKGGLRKPVKCLLCDIYGTLLISGSGDIGVARRQNIEEDALARLIVEYEIPQSPSSLRRNLFEAIENIHHMKKAEGIDHPEVEIDKIWAEILPFAQIEKIRTFAIRWEMAVNPVWPMPGLSELIKACRDTGIKLGIISNAQFFTPLLFEWLLNSDLERLGFDPGLTVLSFQHGRAKPSRSLFASPADRLQAMGIDPGSTAFIGNDMRNDIAPALDVGFQTILFAGDARSLRLRQDDPACRDIEPDLVITQLSQLVQKLAKTSIDT